jgi:hypothetical protein
VLYIYRVSIYNPPRIPGLPVFWPVLQDLISKYLYNLLLHDFNINMLEDTQETTEFLSRLVGVALLCIAAIPTLIDLSITNEPDSLIIFSQLSLQGMKTEHDLIYGSYRICDDPTARYYRDCTLKIKIVNIIVQACSWSHFKDADDVEEIITKPV